MSRCCIEPRVVIKQIVAEDPAAELRRVRAAIAAMRQSIDEMLADSDVAADGEHRDVLEAYRMFAADRGWVRRITEAVQSGLTAEAAVQKVQDDNRARMAQATDPYLRDRLADLEDLGNRLQQHLAGKPITAAGADLPDEFILFAREMGPAELLDYDRKRLKGLVLEEGAPTSHVAIIARALDIPVVGRIESALVKVEAGDTVIVDGDEAQIVLRPGEDVLHGGQRPARGCVPASASATRRCATYPPRRGMARGSRSTSMPVCCSTCRISKRPAPTVSACSAPSCCSCCARSCRT